MNIMETILNKDRISSEFQTDTVFASACTGTAYVDAYWSNMSAF